MAYHRGEEDQNINNAMQQNKPAHASWYVKKEVGDVFSTSAPAINQISLFKEEEGASYA